MKKNILTVILIVTATTTMLFSCNNRGNDSNNPPTESVKEQYQCPMKCSEENFDKPGQCPVCEMDLEKVTES